MIKWITGLFNKKEEKKDSRSDEFVIEVDLGNKDEVESFKNGGADKQLKEFASEHYKGFDAEKYAFKTFCEVDFEHDKCRVYVNMIEIDKYTRIDDDGIGVTVGGFPNQAHNVRVMSSIDKIMPRMYLSMLTMMYDYREECAEKTREMRYEIEKLEKSIGILSENSEIVGRMIDAIENNTQE